MDRVDGKHPFDPETYKRPAVSIKTMIELRAFCAHFFDVHIRNSVNIEEEDVAAFLVLITHSPDFFARARAVIPELQTPGVESSYLNHLNDNVKAFLHLTCDVRGPPGKKWELLPEESAWTKLAKKGMKNLARELAKEGKGHQKQASDASSRGSSVIPTVLAPGKAEFKPADSLLHSPSNVNTKPKGLPPNLGLAEIPTFVPRNSKGSDELVWSPTSGTRPRRSDEIYQPSPGARQANTPQFGQGIPSNVSSASNLGTQYLFHSSRDLSDRPTKSHRHSGSFHLPDSLHLPPPPQFKSTQSLLNPSTAWSSGSKENPNPSHSRRNNLEETPFPNSIDSMMEMATLSHDPNSRFSPPSHFDTTAYPVTDLSRANSPSQFKGPRYPSSQARGVYGAEPFSAPPSIPGYGNLHQTGQGMYGGPPSPFQGQLGHFQPGPDAVASFGHPFLDQVPFIPLPEIRATRAPHPRRGAPPNQMPNQITRAPRPRRGAPPNQMPNQITQRIPQMMAQTQIPPPRALAPSSETLLIVPPPGSMLPIDYWNMLHQRGTEICTRLQHANRPMTDQERVYIASLDEARITAVATKIPVRGNMSKDQWVTELDRTRRSIWETGPGSGDGGFNPVIVARKSDFEKAVDRELELTLQEE